MVDYIYMLETQPQSSSLQGGTGSTSPSTEVPQQPQSSGLQDSAAQDVLAQPSTEISVPNATHSTQQAIEQQDSVAQEDSLFPINSLVLVGAFTFALLLIVLLAKLAKPASSELHSRDMPEPERSPAGSSATNASTITQHSHKKSKKKTRRQRRNA